MAYQRGSLKKVRTKKGWIWVLRYRIKGAEQTPLAVGLVSHFPTEDDANAEVDRLGLRVYTPELYEQKCQSVYQHVFDSYQEQNKSLYVN
jgi:hypothetical protein